VDGSNSVPENGLLEAPDHEDTTGRSLELANSESFSKTLEIVKEE
jgi:hypothetical protein